MRNTLRPQESAQKIAVVILAAGESKRFGSPKQLADWNGEPLLLSVIRKVERCGMLPFIALGAHKQQIYDNKSLSPYTGQIISVDSWHNGISASITASIEFLLARPVKGVLFILGDQPLIDVKHLQRLLSLAQASPEQTFCTAYSQDKSKFGVPAYFPQATFEKLLCLQADQGAKWLLRSEQPTVIAIESNMSLEDALLDVDRPEDLIRAKSLYNRTRLFRVNGK